jgi:GNAT superfamily N-acetyltransferase
VTAFIKMPYDVYRGDPHWVPPLEGERRALSDRRNNPFFEFGEVELFLARRGGRVVGRVAAMHNPRHNALHTTRDGFFGLFECVDDAAVAQALFDEVTAWLAERGRDTIEGPVSFFAGGPCGVLAEGFDAPPAVLTPYNPSYYPELLESCGLFKARDLWAWEAGPEPPERIERIARSVQAREGLTVRTLDLGDLRAEIGRMKAVYRGGWAPNWGFAPMTDRELAYLFEGLRRVVRPEAVLLCEAHGEPVGFALGLPDVNQAVRRRGGPLGRWGRPVRRPRATRVVNRWRAVAFGVRDGFRGRGLEALLLAELWRSAHRLGCAGWEASWTLQDNHAMNRVMEVVGATRAKTYRIYRRPL